MNQLAWTTNDALGVIAGGLENGEIVLWNAKSVVESKADAQIVKQKRHGGAVRGLDFNPSQPNLLATGATEGEVRWVMDVDLSLHF